MTISVFDIYTVGIGPSSSHTVGPMRAARRFAEGVAEEAILPDVRRLLVELFGSLAFTGKGHGTDRAVILGLEGHTPEGVDPDAIDDLVAARRQAGRVRLAGTHEIAFDEKRDLRFHRKDRLPLHSNGMRYTAFDDAGRPLRSRVYYSVGGGFVADEGGALPAGADADHPVPFPFRSGDDLLAMGRAHGLSLSGITMENEKARRSEASVRARLSAIWDTMQACVRRGCDRPEGYLPGPLQVARRAPALYRTLRAQEERADADPLNVLDWVSLYALAVNEENASGGRVVTAPTNGAAGIVPAVLHYYARFCPGAGDDGVARFLLAAGAIAILYKENASISGAEAGCQGEVGVACSMAAAGLADALGGTIEQVEEAAEIGMEHNLGLTCDPVGGLVQIPCIERNAMGAVKAINAARLALRGDGTHRVSLDKVIRTMRQTGLDMKKKYKETARGGLAVNVIEC